MAYQYVREPLRAKEADTLCHACETTEDKLIVWTLLLGLYRLARLRTVLPCASACFRAKASLAQIRWKSWATGPFTSFSGASPSLLMSLNTESVHDPQKQFGFRLYFRLLLPSLLFSLSIFLLITPGFRFFVLSFSDEVFAGEF